MVKIEPYTRLFFALLISNGVSGLLYLSRVIDSNSSTYWFLQWNLFLAWLPLVCSLWLVKELKRRPWLSKWPISLTVLWLVFLPNSFYITSDLVHLQPTGQISFLYDAVLFMSFIANGLILGYISLYIVHKQLLKRLVPRVAHSLIAGALLLSSFAIYLGRYLHWNSWDVILHPAGLIFDVSESFINPISNPQVFLTTLTFFVLLGSTYVVIWEVARALGLSLGKKL